MSDDLASEFLGPVDGLRQEPMADVSPRVSCASYPEGVAQRAGRFIFNGAEEAYAVVDFTAFNSR